jgi:hypothetical protein
MAALGLRPGNTRDEGIYRNMRVWQQPHPESKANVEQDEAIRVYNALNSDRSSLMEPQRSDPSYQAPFFWHHIRQERRRQAIIDTWQHARPQSEARIMFDRGATPGEHGPNWVTAWLLYSVFRSRDVRNNRNRRAGKTSDRGAVGTRNSID